jgi:hypothetical protein
VTLTAGQLEELAVGGLVYPIPERDKIFVDGATLAAAPDLDILAAHLVTKYDEFRDLHNFKLRVLWKDGKPRWLGKASSKGEEDHLLSGIDMLIKIAWDNCRRLKITANQMEALLYHELCHFEVETDDNDKQKLTMRYHDVEEFNAVILRYGDWRHDVRGLDRQLELHLIDVVNAAGS